jgi:biopolymer transport protein ExbB/TolQ
MTVRVESAENGQPEAMIVVIVVLIVILVVGLVAFFAAKARADHRAEAQRYEAHAHRELADVTELESTRLGAEAEERAARAKREQVEAEQQRLEAERNLAAAADLRTKADELDPDVVLDESDELAARQRD